MKKEEILLQNEYEVNNMVAKIFKIIITLVPIIFITKLLGLFISPWLDVIILLVVLFTVGIVPIVLNKNNNKDRKIKYFAVLGILFLALVAYSLIFVNSIFLWMVPLMISGLYFDKKLIKISIFLIIPLMILGEIIAEKTGQEFIASIHWVPIHVISFGMQLIIVGYLFSQLVQRANQMLFETKNLLDEINEVFLENNEIAKDVEESVDELVINMSESNKSLKYISETVGLISSNSEDFLDDVGFAREKAKEIYDEIKEVGESSLDIIQLAKNASSRIHKSSIKLENSVQQIETIEVSSEKSKEAVKTLVKRTKEIGESLELITKIQKETNLLAINASIEASRAGDIGKGFAVVAVSITDLAVKSAQYTEKIRGKLKVVENESSKAISMINESFDTVVEGIASISLLKEDFKSMVGNQEKIILSVDEMQIEMQKLGVNGEVIEEKMDELKKSNEGVVDKMHTMTGAIEELSGTFDLNIQHLEKIDKKAKSLGEEKHTGVK